MGNEGTAATTVGAGARRPLLSRLASSRRDWPQHLLRRIVRPHWLIVAPVAVSGVVWLIPWGDGVHRGFLAREDVSLAGLAILAAWYAVAIGSAFAGFQFGLRIRPLARWDEFPDARFYGWFTVIGLLGVAYSYGRVAVEDPGLVVRAFENRAFNEIRLALDYGTGVHTLRYATVIAGGWALYNVALRGRINALHVLNLVLLVAAAAIASRLSFVMATVIALGAFARDATRERPRLARLGAVLVAAALALTGFNYLRNANYYETYYEVRDPFTMSAYEAIAYLGAPFQASVAAANDLATDEPDDRMYPTTVDGVVGNYVVNPGGEAGAVYWEAVAAGEPVAPDVTRAADDAIYGRAALGVTWANMTRRAQTLYSWTSGQSILQVAGGERWYVRVSVRGDASVDRPIRLGVRTVDGITQEGLEPIGTGITKRSRGLSTLEAVYTVPPGISYAQLALWKDGVRPGTTGSFVFDGAMLGRLRSSGTDEPAPLAERLGAFLVPAYVPLPLTDAEIERERYREYADVNGNLTTNSVFASMTSAVGALAFLLIALVAFPAALLAGYASRHRSLVFLAALVVGYAFAELWRVNLFDAGIIHFLLLLFVTIPLVDGVLRGHLLPRMRRARVSSRRRGERSDR